jgi:hypothetical protein
MDKLVKRLIQDWSGLEWESEGFRERLRAWLSSRLVEDDEEIVGAQLDEEDNEAIRGIVDDILKDIGRRIPDLFRFEGKMLQVLEVEDTSTLKQDKLWQYCKLWCDLDTYGLKLQLIVTDRYGVSPTELPLMEFYFSFLAEGKRLAKSANNAANRRTS